MADGRVLVLVLSALAPLSACPREDPPLPDSPPPVVITAAVAPGAPVPDAGDAPDVVLPRDVADGVVVVDVGLVALVDGISADILVEAKSLGSMTVLVYGHDGAHVILERAVDPDGNAVVDDAVPAGLPDEHQQFARGFPAQVFSQNRTFGSALNGSFLVPNTPDIAHRDGTWTLRVSQWTVDTAAQPPTRTPLDRPVHVVIVARGADAGAGRIDLNLRFAGELLRAADAPDDATLQGALDVVREAYAGANIEIGEVRYLDHATDFAVVELVAPCEGGQLFDLARSTRDRADGPGADIFFVDGFACELGGVVITSIAGLAAGVPGPPFVRGSEHAGVAVRYAEARDDDDARTLGVVIAHELAHFLGLYHTREASFLNAPPIFDEIADSPDGDDADENLMFFGAESVVTLSAGQGQVLRTSPMVTPVTPPASVD